MQTAQVVRAIDHRTIVQVICLNDMDLLSVYFEPGTYVSLCKAIEKAGLKLEGLKITFDCHKANVPALDNSWAPLHFLSKKHVFPLAS